MILKRFSLKRLREGHDEPEQNLGRNFHEDPVVMHVGRPKQGVVLKPGMTFTIEPMINMGSAKTVSDDDGWTARTAPRTGGPARALTPS